MKIIKQGRKPETMVYFFCDNCGCEFEADQKECSPTSWIAMVHDDLGSANCKCPYCGRTVYSNRQI